jgi:hypothetical protein
MGRFAIVVIGARRVYPLWDQFLIYAAELWRKRWVRICFYIFLAWLVGHFLQRAGILN